MAIDTEQIQTDADYLTQQPGWQDEAKRGDWLRGVAVQTRPQADDPAYHAALMGEMWKRTDTRSTAKKAGQFVARGVEEMAKSFPAAGGAAVFAAGDAFGMTDTGSGARFESGVKTLLDSTGQRIKSLAPNDAQQQRDAALDALKEDLDGGAHPPGLEAWLAGEFDKPDGPKPDADTQQWIDGLTAGLARKAVQADHMGTVDEAKVKNWLAGDRNPATAVSGDGEAGPREWLADYVATRDPASWEAFKNRVQETDAQKEARARNFVAGMDSRAVLADMPAGLSKELIGRSFDMQASPIDLASSALPLLRGAKALQAARAGTSVAGRLAMGAGKEALQEGATEYLQDARASGAQVFEAAALGAIGNTAVEGTMAGVGRLTRKLEGGRLKPEVVSDFPTPTSDLTPSVLGSIAQNAGRRAVVPVPDVESGLYEAPQPEGDVRTQLRQQAPLGGEMPTDTGPSLDGQPIDETPQPFNPPEQIQGSPASLEITPPIPNPASVTEPASEVPTPPAASPTAPVAPDATDAGSTPAAGASLTFDEFATSRGVSRTPPSFAEAHRKPGKESKQSRKSLNERMTRAMDDWQSQRDALRAEYDQGVANGSITAPSTLERTAAGTGERAEAARRVVAKRKAAMSADAGSTPAAGATWESSAEFEQAEALAMAGDIEAADALEASWNARQSSPSASPAAPAVNPAIQALRDSNASLPAAAQAKWTPEVYAAAGNYFATGNESALSSLSPIQKRRVMQARLAADPVEMARQDAQDRAAEKQLAREETSEKRIARRDQLRREQVETWADEVIDSARGRVSMGIDPKLMAAYTIKGARMIETGLRDFSAWSKAMLAKFGEVIRAHLADIWQQITTRQMPKLGGGTVTVRRPEGGFAANPFHRGGAFRVRNQGLRHFLTGSALPQALAPLVTASQNETAAIRQSAAALGNDLNLAMQAYAKRTGQTEQQINDSVEAALEGTLPLNLLGPDLGERVRRVRNMLDDLSTAIGNQTGGNLGKQILGNLGQWMRRSYAAFDPDANWNYESLERAAKRGDQIAGKDARQVFNTGKRFLQQQNPQATAGEIEAMMRQLMDRDLWERNLSGNGGAGVRKDVSSLMHRKVIPTEIRALMGEEHNPVKRFLGSVRFQSQYIARHEQQKQMREIGLKLGLFSTKQEGVFTEPVGDERSTSGFAAGGAPVYTTPELKQALAYAPGAIAPTDLGSWLLKAVHYIAGQFKLNKVALNPDSWLVNLLGNVAGLAQTGGMINARFLLQSKKAIELMRSGKAAQATTLAQQALIDARREFMARLSSAGVSDSSLNMALVEDGLNDKLVQFISEHDAWNGAAGAAKLAVIGQALGKPFGVAGRAVGGAAGGVAGYLIGNKRVVDAQKAVAAWTMQNPDRFGKIVEFLDNYETGLRAGMTDAQAFQTATDKTLNTMPDYSKLPAPLRQASRLGVVGTFIAFQWEVYRNGFHNARYALEEIGSGNPALMAKGARRLIGQATVYALAAGGLQAILGKQESDDEDKSLAYRRALGKPWERFSKLAFTRLDKEGASFYNTSYLLPQVTVLSLIEAAREGKTFEEAMDGVGSVLQQQFFETGAHVDTLTAAFLNWQHGGYKTTNEEGSRAFVERLAEVLAPMTPGAADKWERLARSKEALNRPRWDREFSVEEEMKRLLGVRQMTYTHDRRVASRLHEFMDQKRDISSTAEKVFGETGRTKTDEWGRQAQQAAAARANERLDALKQRYEQFKTDLGTLGFSPAQIERHRKDAGMSPNWTPYQVKPDGIKQAVRR